MAFFPRFMAHEFAPMFRLMDDYATHALSRNGGNGSAFGPAFNLNNSLRTFEPRFDVKENRDNYELQGELPGIEQKDLTLEFTDANTLSIRGRTETFREEGTRPAAFGAIEGHGDQKKITEADKMETESTTSSGYHKATVEDESGNATTANADNQVATNGGESQEVAQQSKSDSPKYWVSERSVGSFARSFSFPTRVDQDAVKASLKNGILSIVVPKATAPANRKINIE
jgi:HSP20 family molecular chaperone IbpA